MKINTIKIDHPVKLIAHRGLSGIEKENTMASFIAAGNRSYFGIECDIQPTLDGKFVIMHDDDTSRVSKRNINIISSNYEEIRKINLIDNNDLEEKDYLKVPLFEDYLKACIKYSKVCVVEYKVKFSEKQLEEVVEIVKKYNYLENTIFISFYVENLILLRKNHPTLNIQYLCGECSKKILDDCLQYRFGIDIHWSHLNEKIVSLLHQHNLEVNVWVVNKKDLADKLVAMNVDYITTDILE